MINLLLFLGGTFQHHSGREYELLMVTNQQSNDQQKFPTTAVYKSKKDDLVWSRPIQEFIQNFILIA